MFAYEHVVKLHDTDCYGIIFFANQFLICHDAWQMCMQHVGIPMPPDRRGMEALPVIVHAECDYAAKVVVGDVLHVVVSLDTIGTTSFAIRYAITNQRGATTGSAKTVHVCIDPAKDRATDIPPAIRTALSRI
ncbi:MAG: thioesterase family protein [Planctomycetota bacterium]